jgi:hypothetical protein
MKQTLVNYLIGGGAALVASAAARALPKPDPAGSKAYGFLYAFAQNILANFDKNQPAK